MRRTLANISLGIVFLTITVQITQARPHRVAQIPNGSASGCMSCHTSASGGSRNDFGEMIEDDYLSGGNVVWGPELAAADADGDGFSNGHELEDPFGVWTNGTPNPGTASFVTSPGVNSSVPSGDASKSSLHMQFTDMTPHVGQYFEIRLVDASNNSIVASEELTSIGDAAYEFVFLHALDDGTSYNVDFWSDHNGNGSYDAPPTDHAWRVVLNPISGNTVSTFAHNTSFTDIGGAVSIDPIALAPSSFVLLENYPNPFNPETNISFELLSSGHIDLDVYSIQGKHVANVYSGIASAGYQSIPWTALNTSGDELSTGVYIYTLRTDQGIQTKRMMLLK